MPFSTILASDANQNIDPITNTVSKLILPGYYYSDGVVTGRCRIQVRTAAILFTTTSVTPKAGDEGTGEKANVVDVIILDTLVEMRNMQMCRATSTDGAVFVTYEKTI